MILLLAVIITFPSPTPTHTPIVTLDETQATKRHNKHFYFKQTYYIYFNLFGKIYKPMRFREIPPEHLK